jgi:hypothetical protein
LLVNIIGSLLTGNMTSSLRGILAVNANFKRRRDFLLMLAAQIGSGATLAVDPSLLHRLAGCRGIKTLQELRVLQSALIPDLIATSPDIFALASAFSDAQKRQFTNLALAMDLALNVGDKVEISPILIAPAPASKPGSPVLVGEPLFVFAGFLVSDFRTRDFEQGRYDAWQTWDRIAQSQPGEFEMPTENSTQYPPPIKPETAVQVMTTNQKDYNQERDKFFKRVDIVAEAIAKGSVRKGGPIGSIEERIVTIILDALARKALS